MYQNNEIKSFTPANQTSIYPLYTILHSALYLIQFQIIKFSDNRVNRILFFLFLCAFIFILCSILFLICLFIIITAIGWIIWILLLTLIIKPTLANKHLTIKCHIHWRMLRSLLHIRWQMRTLFQRIRPFIHSLNFFTFYQIPFLFLNQN